MSQPLNPKPWTLNPMYKVPCVWRGVRHSLRPQQGPKTCPLPTWLCRPRVSAHYATHPCRQCHFWTGAYPARETCRFSSDLRAGSDVTSVTLVQIQPQLFPETLPTSTLPFTAHKAKHWLEVADKYCRMQDYSHPLFIFLVLMLS